MQIYWISKYEVEEYRKQEHGKSLYMFLVYNAGPSRTVIVGCGRGIVHNREHLEKLSKMYIKGIPDEPFVCGSASDGRICYWSREISDPLKERIRSLLEDSAENVIRVDFKKSN